MNVLTIAGTVGRSEVKYLQSGDAVLEFTVADSEGRDKPTTWWRCSLFGKRAESLGSYVQVGGKVTVTGRFTGAKVWRDKSNNEQVSLDVRVNNIALQGGGSRDEPSPAQRRAPAPAAYNDDDSDIPF